MVFSVFLLSFFAEASPQDHKSASEDDAIHQFLSEGVGGETVFSIGLSLEDALRSAIENNLEFAKEKLLVVSAGVVVDRAEIPFRTALNGSFATGSNRQIGQLLENGLVTPSQLTATESFQISLRKRLEYGTELSLTTFANQLDSNFGDSRVRTSSTRAILRITQPLLKNRGAGANKAALESARIRGFAAEHSLRREALRLAVEVEADYWDLAFAEGVEALRIESFALAEQYLEKTERLLEMGRASRIDLLEAQNGTVQREQELIAARVDRIRLAERLRLSIFGDVLPQNSAMLYTASKPASAVRLSGVEQLERIALESREDLREARNRLRASELELAAARQNALPQIDLVGSFGSGGTAVDLSSAFTGLRNNDSPTWSIGLAFSMPFGGDSADAGVAEAQIVKRRNEFDVELAEKKIRLEVQEAYRDVEVATIQLQATQKNVSLANELLSAAEKRYELDMIDLYRLLESEKNATQANLALLSRKLSVARAAALLRLAVGSSDTEFADANLQLYDSAPE